MIKTIESEGGDDMVVTVRRNGHVLTPADFVCDHA